MREPANLHLRIETLERPLKLLQFTIGLLVIGVLGPFALAGRPVSAAGETGSGIIRARAIVITDARGVERILIGAPVPSAVGEKGPRVAQLAGLTINDDQGRERFGLGTMTNGWTILGFDAAPGTGTGSNRERLHLGVDDEGHGFVRLLDQQSRLAGRFMLNDQDRAVVELWGKPVNGAARRGQLDYTGWHALAPYSLGSSKRSS